MHHREGQSPILRFNTIGGVIPPASKILEIVPDDEALLLEAKIAANDIDVVFPGLEARVKLWRIKRGVIFHCVGVLS